MTTGVKIARNGAGCHHWLVLSVAVLSAGLGLAFSRGALAWGTDDARMAADIAELLAIEPGSTVAEVGAGHGEMTARIAEKVGPTGHVYSTEIDADRRADIRKRVAHDKLANVSVVEATPTDTGLPVHCCDAIYMIGVYHHITDPVATDRSLFGALKPGGRLLVNDFPPTLWLWPWTPAGVPADRGGHGVSDRIVTQELTQAGFQQVRKISPWHAGFLIRTNYALVFRKPPEPAAPR